MAIKKNIAVRLGVIYEFQVTNRKQGRLQQEPPPPWHTPIVHLGVIVIVQPEWRKIPPETVGCSNSLIEKSLKTSLIRYNFNTLCEEYI
jgi:hypothetical protein